MPPDTAIINQIISIINDTPSESLEKTLTSFFAKEKKILQDVINFQGKSLFEILLQRTDLNSEQLERIINLLISHGICNIAMVNSSDSSFVLDLLRDYNYLYSQDPSSKALASKKHLIEMLIRKGANLSCFKDRRSLFHKAADEKLYFALKEILLPFLANKWFWDIDEKGRNPLHVVSKSPLFDAVCKINPKWKDFPSFEGLLPLPSTDLEIVNLEMQPLPPTFIDPKTLPIAFLEMPKPSEEPHPQPFVMSESSVPAPFDARLLEMPEPSAPPLLLAAPDLAAFQELSLSSEESLAQAEDRPSPVFSEEMPKPSEESQPQPFVTSESSAPMPFDAHLLEMPEPSAPPLPLLETEPDLAAPQTPALSGLSPPQMEALSAFMHYMQNSVTEMFKIPLEALAAQQRQHQLELESLNRTMQELLALTRHSPRPHPQRGKKEKLD